MRIFVTADYFLPGYKAGGPIQSLANFSREFCRQHEMYFFTRDRDATDTKSYDSIVLNDWNARYGGFVYYASPENINKRALHDSIADVEPDCIYLNSLFSPLSRYVMLSRSMRKVTASCKIVLAVRGELNPGALGIHPIRKKAYLAFLRRLGACRNIRFQASCDSERLAIRRWFPGADVVVAGNIPSEAPHAIDKVGEKISDVCSFVFAGRKSPMKNLEFLLERLAELPDEEFHLNIYGPISDRFYWNRCQSTLVRLNGKVSVHGAYRPEEIWGILAKSRFMVLPTLGENFGHSIYEAAASGTPYVISDRTPWTERSRGRAGWALPLQDVNQWRNVLRECIHMEPSRYVEMVDACRAVAAEVKSQAVAQHARLFG